MTAGGVVLSPSSGSHVVQLSSRLIVGVRLHGTIAAPNPRRGGQLTCRPFLRYFGETLRRLRCDVTLFAPVTARQITQLRRDEFPCDYRVVNDPTSGGVADAYNNNSSSSSSSRGCAARANFQDLLSRTAMAQSTCPSRVLFIESEINCRFSPVQTLVVEAFKPRRVRQRQRQQVSSLLSRETEEARRAGEYHTALLEAEHSWTQGGRGRFVSGAAPFSSEMHSEENNNKEEENVRSAALAINREDYTLVALAGMLVELAAADVSVADYLRVEPLVEKLTVPFHGEVNYLPVENCDDMELWDWDAVEVREAKRQEEEVKGAVPDVVERDEHKGLFK